MKSWNKQKGQSLVEFLIFLPVMLILYSLILTVISSINGSINQQKILRSYFFYLLSNDSNAPNQRQVSQMQGELSGMLALGWKFKFQQGNLPMTPCYTYNKIGEPTAEDKCEERYQGELTNHIRVGTVFGICTGNYLKVNDETINVYYYPALYNNFSGSLITEQTCHNF